MNKKLSGNLIIIGGAEDKEGRKEILKKVCECIKKEDDDLVIATIATEYPEEAAEKYRKAFGGLNDEYIEGIFVSDEMQSCGIGKLLLDYIKDKKVSLRLNVYQKNARAISFYQREGFIIQCEDLDEDTGEKEYTMLWKRK